MPCGFAVKTLLINLYISLEGKIQFYQYSRSKREWGGGGNDFNVWLDKY